MAGAVKKSTNIKGLAVSAQPHIELTPLYNRILRMLDKMPKEYTYRKETEKLVKDRLKIVKENADVQAIEKKIGCGQVEELIIQAKNEMSLSEKILVWKPWEKLIQEAPPNQWTWPPHK
ncbi:NADH dehydrogenase [ubiquinone] 1 alpha subcomplex subunit 5 [Camponotus floridanus]|uniref:NADH dehydrogenase [ubiquinone] 1 alpha subcomplex subunit 5 n=1 Tax=Camponotus floridanus TaxID=104421 RepID=E2AZD2_CAMFO|nr:NADH dehydrogenase [ubiquinone] 1 alpha subcomplex subunit 5 [Camponotus floridanus]EFN61171.1 NADH dehydrogenase [ubiquinone] 1 alpha subcomplex subunit 5 [Camponotus floridanus]